MASIDVESLFTNIPLNNGKLNKSDLFKLMESENYKLLFEIHYHNVTLK